MSVCVCYQKMERILESRTIGAKDCISEEYWCSHEHSSWPNPGHAVGMPPCGGSVGRCFIPQHLRGELEEVEPN